MAYDDLDIPTQPLPSPSIPLLNALKAAMFDAEAKQYKCKVCISGDKGTGKTTSIVKLMQRIIEPGQRIIFVDSAENVSSLNNERWLLKNVKVLPYENMEQLQGLAAAVRDKLFPNVGAVILDEYSSIVAMDRAWIIKARSAQVREITDAKAKGFKDPFTPERPDYLASQMRSNDVIAAFMQADTHFGVVTHEKLDKDTVMIRPDLPPGAAHDMEKVLHGVFRAIVEKDANATRRLQLQPNGTRVSVKNRIGGLGNFATVDEVAEAYKQWGVIEETPTTTTLTEAEVKQVKQDDDLLELLMKSNEE